MAAKQQPRRRRKRRRVRRRVLGRLRFTEQELKNRYAKFKSESKSRAENSKWWREEKKEAEKNKKEFNEKAFQARARKAGRDAERLKRSGGFVARTGYVWQDAMVGMVSVAICIGAWDVHQSEDGAKGAGEAPRGIFDDERAACAAKN